MCDCCGSGGACGMLVSPDSVYAPPDLARLVRGVAAVLADQGVRPGDRVALKAANSSGYVIVLFALVHVGVSVVLLDHDQRSADSGLVAGQARVSLVVTDEHAQPVPGPAGVSIMELLHAAAGRDAGPGPVDTTRWAALPDALILFSSGSTGVPKGVVKSGAGTLDNARRTIERMGYGRADVLMPMVPFSHQYGVSLLLTVLLTGSGLVVAPYRRLDRAVWMADRAHATVLDATPATYRSMLNLLDGRPALQAHLDRIRMYCAGGAPLSSALAGEFEARLGRPLLDGYGSTELGNVSFATPDRPLACGPLLPGLDVLITDDDGTPLPPGEIGALSVRTPDAFTGYLAADGTVTPRTGDWWPTGDLATVDESGCLDVVGRRKAVHRMGYTLHPEVLERRAAACGAAVWIVPRPDERMGNRLVFVVEDRAGRPAAHWRARLESVLAPFEQPNRIVVIGEVPLSRTGKPDRIRLAELADAPEIPAAAAV